MDKKIAIMQPYFLPYIGYFQLINSVDEFIIYDNIQYTKKGWINRNKILLNGEGKYISIPLKKDSDFLQIRDRYLSSSWEIEKKKILNSIIESYRNAPNFESIITLIKSILEYDNKNLFEFIFHSIQRINFFLEIKTPIIKSSNILIDHDLKSENKVIELCKSRFASHYINPIGGLELYSREEFKNKGLELYFLKVNNFIYHQFKNEFVPFLSIIDVMMFNSKEKIINYINSEFIII